MGDRLFPRAGNSGYDVLHYGLSLRYRTSKPAQALLGTVTIDAVASKALSRFDLDFAGSTVGSVRVNGEPAVYARRFGELVITPAKALAQGKRFKVQVVNFTARPAKPGNANYGFFYGPDGSAFAAQPTEASWVYPCNDHPSDKATFTIKVDVPKGETAVANGVLASKRTTGSRTVWLYQQRQRMSTSQTQVVVGKFTIVNRGKVGPTVVRDVIPTGHLAPYSKDLAVEKSQLLWMEHRVGAYPFNTYGSLIIRYPIGYALDAQTLNEYDYRYFTNSGRSYWSPIMLSYLAAQWFGNSVSQAAWSDNWLSQGHATWYELTYAAQYHYLGVLFSDFHTADLTTLLKKFYALSDQWRSIDGPVAVPALTHPYGSNVYAGGALVLYALREKIGSVAFANVERSWATTYAGRSASTQQFIALASKVSGQDLTAFLTDWLYGTTTPPMPGHPDWTVDPVTPAAAAKAAEAGSPSFRFGGRPTP